ncbi:MAG: rod shape-determining protein MreD [Prevotella sp.]|nr:rod shape-determining protein MreD [Prevotella sp.]MCM1074695.1 hypothetical protein [Ruminococcus sp.]
MGLNVFTYTLLIISLVFAQVLIFNHIMLFGLAAPIVFFYPFLRLPMSMSVKGVLTIAFVLGIIVDMFSDTPGVNTISCCILAVLRKPIFHLFTGNDEALQGVAPSISTLGFWTFFKYLLLLTPIYCLSAIGLEYFTFTGVVRTLLIIGASSLLSFLLILGIDALTSGRSHT